MNEGGKWRWVKEIMRIIDKRGRTVMSEKKEEVWGRKRNR